DPVHDHQRHASRQEQPSACGAQRPGDDCVLVFFVDIVEGIGVLGVDERDERDTHLDATGHCHHRAHDGRHETRVVDILDLVPGEHHLCAVTALDPELVGGALGDPTRDHPAAFQVDSGVGATTQ